jgi:ankyrin repeat protein
MITYALSRNIIFLAVGILFLNFHGLWSMQPEWTKAQANEWLLERSKLKTVTEIQLSAPLMVGADIDAQDAEQKTALHGVIENERADLVAFLIGRGAPVNNKLSQRNVLPPLVVAAKTGNVAIARLLNEHGAPIQDTHHGITSLFDIRYTILPLQMAARCGHKAMVQFLLEKGARVNSCGSSVLTTPLSEAAEGGHLEIVALLLDQGANIHGKAAWRAAECFKVWNPVTWGEAGMEGVGEMICSGIGRYVGIDRTPLQRAIAHGHANVALLLLNRGAVADPLDLQKFEELQRSHKAEIELPLKAFMVIHK